MNAAVFEIVEEQVYRLFKIVIVFYKLFVKRDVCNGRSAAYAVWVNLGNRIEKRRKSLSVVSAALPKAEFKICARKSSVRR